MKRAGEESEAMEEVEEEEVYEKEYMNPYDGDESGEGGRKEGKRQIRDAEGGPFACIRNPNMYHSSEIIR